MSHHHTAAPTPKPQQMRIDRFLFATATALLCMTIGVALIRFSDSVGLGIMISSIAVILYPFSLRWAPTGFVKVPTFFVQPRKGLYISNLTADIPFITSVVRRSSTGDETLVDIRKRLLEFTIDTRSNPTEEAVEIKVDMHGWAQTTDPYAYIHIAYQTGSHHADTRETVIQNFLAAIATEEARKEFATKGLRQILTDEGEVIEALNTRIEKRLKEHPGHESEDMSVGFLGQTFDHIAVGKIVIDEDIKKKFLLKFIEVLEKEGETADAKTYTEAVTAYIEAMRGHGILPQKAMESIMARMKSATLSIEDKNDNRSYTVTGEAADILKSIMDDLKTILGKVKITTT
jgi:hypothetical protein